ncbi:PD-(D/E)XK motif protein [Planococcus ruber]|uniref:PD-(D/E)XK motif protein n=1 Tax=Planococcus ruber TaxID=2027871 RepID=UPI001FEEC067|nr:PD-(D/E)XK motif protein [Planococcus ruber]MCJ1907743.1 PD-(D/E)XK motif protein [Planococcus ruber]
MDTVQNIKNGFAYIRTSSKRLITLKEEYYWIVKIDGMQGVAIDIPKDINLNEQFASIFYYTKEYLINGEEYNLLLLVSNNSNLSSEFVYICAAFLEQVLDAEIYEEIQRDPIYWWHAMKELMGNANIEKAAYSVLAEMVSYYYLLKYKKEVSWVGPFGGSVDFNCEDSNYEIKSTVARYGSQITVNSQYQLKADYLLFFRFEPSINGISIQSMAELLINEGVEESIIENALQKLNYPVGSEIRKKSYALLDAKKYTIDEDFPKILPESFKDEKLPKHITGLTYKLELEGLSGEKINIEGI